MKEEKELIEKVKELDGLAETFKAILTLTCIDLGWENHQIRAFLRVSEDHLNFLRVIR